MIAALVVNADNLCDYKLRQKYFDMKHLETPVSTKMLAGVQCY